MRKMRVLSVFGTRPEAIKMAPVVQALGQSPLIESVVAVTAQHRQMLDQVLDLFQIVPDYDLDLMRANQDLTTLSARILTTVKTVLNEVRPDVVLVHGDTTTCLMASLAAFYARVPIGHVEAGLRSGRMDAPFPEEANRTLVAPLVSYHFAPTQKAQHNLYSQGIANDKIWITGNTVIDALLKISESFDSGTLTSTIALAFPENVLERLRDRNRRLIVITGHRRESFGQGMINLCDAIQTLANRHRDVDFVYPVHFNPSVRDVVHSRLENIENIFLMAPLDYLPFVWLMNRSTLIISDSGGIQEEAPSLGKPVLVTREVTERSEAVAAGTVRLVGTNAQRIINETHRLLTDPEHYQSMSNARNPYGDGTAAKQIVGVLEEEARRLFRPSAATNIMAT